MCLKARCAGLEVFDKQSDNSRDDGEVFLTEWTGVLSKPPQDIGLYATTRSEHVDTASM